MAFDHAQHPFFEELPGTGPTLVFLHYWGGSARTWGPLAEQLSDFHRIAIDFRGWGRSRTVPGPFTLQQSARDVAEVVAAAGVADYVLVGHSRGGKVAQLVAAERPAGLRGLVLLAPAPARPASSITPEYQEALSHAYDTPESIAGARDHILTAAPLPDELARQVLADSAAAHDDARTEWPLHGIAEDIADRARLIDAPVLVLAGEHDQVEPAGVIRENLLLHLSGGTLRVIPGAGHLLPLEAPGAVAAAIRGFIAALPLEDQ